MKEEKINIIMVIADSALGGGTNYVAGILEHLDKNKFRLFLLCPEGYLFMKVQKIKDVQVEKIAMQSKFDLVSSKKLKEFFGEMKTKYPKIKTIVHINGPRAATLTYAFIPAEFMRIYTEHLYTKDYHLKNPINEWLQKSFLKKIYRKADKIIAPSTAVSNFLADDMGVSKDKIIIVPNGIEVSKLSVISYQLSVDNKQKTDNGKPLDPGDKPRGRQITIGTIGNLNIQKGHKYLIMAMSKIRKKYPKIQLVIIGEGKERKNLENQINDLFLEKNVKLLGKQENVYKYLKKWQIFILPSLSESFGMAILEAMSASVPVIATSVGGVKDIINNDENGLLISSKNSNELAQVIVRLIDNKKLKDKFIANGYKTALRFDWKNIIKQIEKIYLEI